MGKLNSEGQDQELEKDVKREEKQLNKELKMESNKREGWDSVGLHCPRCNSMDMYHKTIDIRGYLFIDEIPDTLTKCGNCGYKAAYLGMTMIMQIK